MSDKYILHGHEPVPCDDLMEWARWFETTDRRRVAATQIGPITISTVFLGLDHQFVKGGPPLIFETMIFGGPLDLECWRCSTWTQAEKQHTAAVEKVKSTQ